MSDDHSLPLVGHNVGDDAANRLRSMIERIERMGDERRALTEDIKEVFVEAKAAGFNIKVMRHLLQTRRQDPEEVAQFELLVDQYRRALGM